MANQNMASRIEFWPLNRLKPYDKNARTHSDEQVKQIAASILEFGFNNPILVDSESGIVAGHGRLMAATSLDLPEVPVIVLDHLTDAQKRAYVLADNKLALNAGWDDELLAAELKALEDEGFNLDVIGFSDEELADLLEEPVPEILPEQLDEAPEPPVTPTTKPGDLWILGKHRLLCGDATNIDDALRLMNGKKAQLVVTDPPYNVAYEGKTKESLTIQNDSMSGEAFYQFLKDVYATYYAVMDDGAGIYVFHADSEGANFRRAMQDAELKLAQCCIWVKDSMVMGRQDYHWQHEPVLYGWKPTGAHKWYTDRKQTTVWNFARPKANREHPTMKPVKLIEYPIENSSAKHDLVVDFFGGSGSTLIAAVETKRICNTMELDPRYCDVIVRRWQEVSKKKAVLESTGKTFEEMKSERLG